MTKKLPRLIKKGKWDEIIKITEIPAEIWSGQGAEAYAGLREKVIASRDSKRVETLPVAAAALVAMENLDNYTEGQKNKIAAKAAELLL